MSFKDFNYMYSLFLIERCHLYYFFIFTDARSLTHSHTHTLTHSVAHSFNTQTVTERSPLLDLVHVNKLRRPPEQYENLLNMMKK